MPVFLVSIIGGIVSALSTFFANRAGLMLAGLGLTYIGVRGFETILGYVTADVMGMVSSVSSMGSSVASGGSLGSLMIRYAAFAGLFDAINIIISGYMTYASFISVRFILGRLNS